MDIRYFPIINFHPNNETNLIIMVSFYSFYYAKYGDINSGKCLKALKGLKNAVWCIDLF
jgi:hypothetical protein